jgi:hypothetical protein
MKNNTTRTLAIVVLMLTAVTLVVGAITAPSTQSAYAYQKKDNGKGKGNGKTVTIEECKNRGSASGFDTALDQECENLICTHPGDNATCLREGITSSASTPITPTPEPTTTTLRIIKQVVCLPTDPNCSLPDVCEIDLSIFTPDNPNGNTQSFTCQSAVGNGVLFTLQPGSFFFLIEVQGPPFFDVTRSGDCRGTIVAGLLCVEHNLLDHYNQLVIQTVQMRKQI